jgi:hypothetical protein
MKPLLLGAALAFMVGSIAYAEDQAPSAEPNATSPANQATPATPDMKARTAPESNSPAPAAGKNPAFVPDQEWVGRYVYSSDNKDLGKIAAVKTNEIDFDMGGFLGIGAARKHVTTDQVGSVQSDRIVLRLTKGEAEKLPADK